MLALEWLFDLIQSVKLVTFNRYWIDATIALALVTFIWFQWPLLQLRWQIRAFLHTAPDLVVTSLGTLPELQAAFEPHTRLRRTWQGYSRVVSQADWSIGVPSPVPFFTQERLVDTPGQRRLAEAMPGFLTALGILGTFVGLSVGLEELPVRDMATPEGLRTAIIPLLDGMRLAFHTSVVGIFCSIIWSATDRLLLRATQARLGSLHDKLDAMFPPVLETELLHEVVRSQQAQMADLKKFMSDNLIPQMFDGFVHAVQTSLAPLMQRTMTAVEHMGQAVAERQMQGVEDMAAHFLDALNQSLDDQMRELARVLRETVEWQRSVKVELSDLLASIHETGAAQNQTLSKSVEILEGLHRASEAFEERNQRIEDGARALQGVLERLTDTHERTQRSLELAAQAEARLSSLRDQLIQQLATQTQEMRGLWTESREDLKTLTAELRAVSTEARQQLGEDLQAFTERMHQGFAHTFGAFDQHLAEAVTRLGGVVGDMNHSLDDLPVVLTRIEKQAEELTGRLGGVLTGMADSVPALVRQTDEHLAGGVANLAALLENLRAGLAEFQAALQAARAEVRAPSLDAKAAEERFAPTGDGQPGTGSPGTPAD